MYLNEGVKLLRIIENFQKRKMLLFAKVLDLTQTQGSAMQALSLVTSAANHGMTMLPTLMSSKPLMMTLLARAILANLWSCLHSDTAILMEA